MTSRAVLVMALAVAACGGDDDGNMGSVDALPTTSMMVGPSGGTLTVPGGPTLTIPSGALEATVTITISEIGRQPGAVTSAYRFEPGGQTFAMPATVSFPIAASSQMLRVFWSKPAGTAGFDELTSTQTSTAVSAPVTHFSNGFVAPMGTAIALGDNYHYVISKLRIPTTNAQSREYGLDIDGDLMVDNQLGMVMATLASMGLEVQASMDTAVARGEALLLADMQTSSFQSGQSAGFRTLIGTNPQPAACTGTSDTTCGKHLTGTGTFDISPMSPNNAYLVGNTNAGVLQTTSPGGAVIALSFDTGRAFYLNVIGARAKVANASATAITNSVLAGAVPKTEVDSKLIPEFALNANAAIMRDCTSPSSPPGCGCTADSTGKTWVSLFDTDQNCTISNTEVANNSLILSLFAPDMTIDGQEAISIGVGFDAVSATY